ncbi:MAG: glycosyltransferase [Propionibacteriaceae bacterium]
MTTTRMTTTRMTNAAPGAAGRRLRIAVLAHYRHPIAEPYQGGLEMHTALLADELTARGHDVTLLAKGGSRTRARLRPVLPAGFPYGCLPDALGADRSESIADAALLESLSDIAGEVDVILNNSLSTVPYLHLTGRPVLTVLHTPATLERVVEVVAATDWQPGRRHVWAGVSQTTSRDWARWLPDVRWIPNGIDLPHWAPPAGGRPQRRHAVWSGRITPEKGLALAVEAARLGGWRLSISGPVADPDYFAREIAPRLDDRIRYVGHLRHSELPSFLQSGAVYVFTPLWPEPFGLALVEAMACGATAAALPQGAVEEIVGADGGVIAADSSAEKLAVAMEAAARLPRDRVVSSVAGFSKTVMISTYERVLAEMATWEEDRVGDFVAADHDRSHP